MHAVIDIQLVVLLVISGHKGEYRLCQSQNGALQLFRIYGHDPDNERVFFYNNNIEVDFYIPDDELAIQVSYSISKDKDTWDREVSALGKLPKVLPCKRRLILTYDEAQTIGDKYGTIEVIPCWKWLLGM